MVRLEEVEDETFVEKPVSSKDDVLLADDDADYTDTGKPSPHGATMARKEQVKCFTLNPPEHLCARSSTFELQYSHHVLVRH